ncbi:MAG: 1-deoxy-D-xylulose-5-phosphate reductoisomerase, partial [Bacteroidaceae bacterium]|nr:1-deoxy-D-xylulose-5-phosphate reductoisomerase [Bacteroidaceae bacterium]
MMNKGFEVIEAKWLFGVGVDRIRVVVHPQSIVHSAVQFADGAVKAQLGVPDMKVPIQLALSYPKRLQSPFDRLDWYNMPALTFEEPDTKRFPCLELAYEAIRRGGNAACVVNAAHEVANLAFRREQCGFLDIPRIIGQTLDAIPYQQQPTIDDYLVCDAEARRVAQSFIH